MIFFKSACRSVQTSWTSRAWWSSRTWRVPAPATSPSSTSPSWRSWSLWWRFASTYYAHLHKFYHRQLGQWNQKRNTSWTCQGSLRACTASSRFVFVQEPYQSLFRWEWCKSLVRGCIDLWLQGMQKEKMRQRTKVHKAGDLSALHEDVGTEVVLPDICIFVSLSLLPLTQTTSYNYCHRFSQLSMEALMAL